MTWAGDDRPTSAVSLPSGWPAQAGLFVLLAGQRIQDVSARLHTAARSDPYASAVTNAMLDQRDSITGPKESRARTAKWHVRHEW